MTAQDNDLRVLTRRQVLPLLAVGVGGLLSGCSAYEFSTITAPERLTPEIMMARINAVRKNYGRKPVTYNVQLAAAARTHANLMASKDTLSHEIGGTLRERVTAAGYIGAVGENLAGGHRTLEGAIEGWLNSPAHAGTLLSEKFTEFGLAYAATGRKSRYADYWALIMGGSFKAWQTNI